MQFQGRKGCGMGAPNWRIFYKEILSEPNQHPPDYLEFLIHETEDAIFLRLHEVSDSADCASERSDKRYGGGDAQDQTCKSKCFIFPSGNGKPKFPLFVLYYCDSGIAASVSGRTLSYVLRLWCSPAYRPSPPNEGCTCQNASSLSATVQSSGRSYIRILNPTLNFMFAAC